MCESPPRASPNLGVMKYWNSGIMGFGKPNTPIFHYSNTPTVPATIRLTTLDPFNYFNVISNGQRSSPCLHK
jgi:hypothetical protein